MRRRIEFDREFRRGIAAYNEQVGKWWFDQASNRSHSYAYRCIADFIKDSFPEPPGIIADYACGAGNFLARLHSRFPSSRLIGIDGSGFLLRKARRRQALRGADLIETPLPDFSLAHATSDLVVYTFPNMVASSSDDLERTAGLLSPADLAVARHLAEDEDSESLREQGNPATVCACLLRERLVSLNIRRMLKGSGACVRVEYGNVPREQLPKLEQMRIGFEEGSLDRFVRGGKADQWFRVAASRYCRSRVIEDVEHQSGGARGRKGGYLISVLKPV